MANPIAGFDQLMSQMSGLGGTLATSRTVGGSPQSVAEGMGQMLDKAIQQLDGQQKATDAGINRLIAGEPVDIHHVMLQMEQSALGLSMAIQVRNKLVEAYQEIQRMQV